MFNKPVAAAAIAIVFIGVTLPAVSRAAPEVVQFWLIDANTDARLAELSDYQALQLPVLPSGMSIEVVANDETQSVVMRIGATVSSTESLIPYSLGGDSGGNFVPVPSLRTPGWVTISAQPYSADAAAGVAGANATLHLYINQPNFFVTDTRDVGDVDPGDGICSTPPRFNLTSGQSPISTRLPLIGSRLDGTASQGNAIANPIYRLRGGCTLRAAIEEANALPGAQSILIDGTRGTYALTEGRLVITSPVTLTGHELPLIDAQRSQPGVFNIDGGGDDIIVNLQNLEIAGGYDSFERGGGLRIDNNAYVQLSDSVIRDNEANFGGGIYLQNGADLHMRRTVVRNNKAGGDPESFGGGGITQRGGGIFNLGGVVTIDDSAIFDNAAVRGGGLSNFGGTVHINNTSIIGNRAASIGGGIENRANSGTQGNLHLSFVTVAYNRAGVSAADPANQRVGGGIYNTSWAYMANSILARNTDYFSALNVSDSNHAPDCYSPTPYNFKSFRNNTVGVLNAQCSFTDHSWGTAAWIDFGSATTPLNPLFTSRSWWGEMAYYNLHATSPALDNAATASASLFPCPDHDVRDRPRPAGAGCDRGAVERQ